MRKYPFSHPFARLDPNYSWKTSQHAEFRQSDGGGSNTGMGGSGTDAGGSRRAETSSMNNLDPNGQKDEKKGIFSQQFCFS